MFVRKLLSAFLAFLLLVSVLTVAGAEDFVQIPEDQWISPEEMNDASQTLYYKGGVVSRGYLKGANAAAQGPLLEMAYVTSVTPYILLNTATHWDVTISGGTPPYTCQAKVAYQGDLSLDPFGDPWSVPDRFTLSDTSFDYTFKKAGRYFWEFKVVDNAGQCITFQTRIFETYTPADEINENTVAGKVNSIIASEIDDSMSDYARALALHDWLIYNADYSYAHSDAAGVLLHGGGVCDSYARAYLMLCTAAGLECMYVSGTAGQEPDPDDWGNHGWNLVKLNGTWYHVDCTWDDPVPGGYENHKYFCVDDETISADHRWNRPDDVFDDHGMLVPDAEGGSYEGTETELGDYDFTFTSMAEYDQKLEEMIAAGEYRKQIVGKYIGSEETSDVWTLFTQWRSEKHVDLVARKLVTGSGCSCYGPLFTLNLSWASPVSYLRIIETEARIEIGEEYTLYSELASPNEDVYTWSSSDSSVATVEGCYAADSGPYSIITGCSQGTATVTATSPDGITDSLTVYVLPAYVPDFSLTFTEQADGSILLDWNSIPGATGYQVMRTCGGSASCIAEVDQSTAALTAAQLPGNVVQEVYVLALRVIDDQQLVSYQSGKLSYGTLTLSFSSRLPGSIQTIADSAFAGDSALTSLYIPDGAKSIGSSAFRGCSSMTAVRLPASMSSIAADAFANSGLQYAQLVEGSYADTWFASHMPDITIVYE